jgi:hypothetical protein
MKKQKALQNGMNLIAVPCWWDGTPDRYLRKKEKKEKEKRERD